MTDIKYLKGDATNPVASGDKYIIHVCNDIGVWGAGFVIALSQKWRDLRPQYKNRLKELGAEKCRGTNQYLQVENDIIVVNMFAQKEIKSHYNPIPLRYEWLDSCLKELREEILKKDNPVSSVHAPKIGCGLAGGDWDKVEQQIITNLSAYDIPVFIYTLD